VLQRANKESSIRMLPAQLSGYTEDMSDFETASGCRISFRQMSLADFFPPGRYQRTMSIGKLPETRITFIYRWEDLCVT
jgi:hypothetical protein